MIDTRNEVLAQYLDGDGRVARWPIRRKKVAGQQAVIEYLATKFEPNRTYTEREVNAILNQWHTFGDWAMLRRELYDHGFLDRTRDGRQYWVAEGANATP